MADTEYMKPREEAKNIRTGHISDAHTFVAKGMFCLVLSLLYFILMHKNVMLFAF